MSATDVPLSKRRCLGLGSEMITLHVGTAKRALHVHEELICAHSPFFKAAMSNEWTEARARVIELPEDGYNIVSIYLQFLYCGRIFYKEDKDDKNAYSVEIRRLAKSYFFGQKIQDVAFVDTVMDALTKQTKTVHPGPQTVKFIYENTTEKSPLRRLMVDLYVLYQQSGWCSEEQVSVLPQEFLKDIFIAVFKVRPPPNGGVARDKAGDSCIYHQHSINGTACHKKINDA